MFRRSMARERAIVVMVTLFIAVAGCQSTKNPGTETAAMPNDTLPQSGDLEDTLLETTVRLEAVLFDTDRSELRSGAKQALATQAMRIQSHPEWGVLTIEGHCDERGSHEYNLALGKRRAETVKSYLIEQGVPPSRLSTVSFGETKPVSFGNDEMTWQQNRRAELKPEARTAALR